MRHRFHSICPYFAMFPEEFVQRHLTWSRPGDTVLDPFCGRGTKVFESLLRNRHAIGCDTNWVAVCVSRAKANPPHAKEVLARLNELEELASTSATYQRPNEFFRLCYESKTFSELAYLRDHLHWKRRRDDCFIAAMILGMLHGESHKTAACFSNRMPRTISTKPDYSIRWWKERALLPPRRMVFELLRQMTTYRFASAPASIRGHVKHGDVRDASKMFERYRGEVRLVVTSPPYLDTTNYREDQWLRLWFLGEGLVPERTVGTDDRHRSEDSYWAFLTDAWAGIAGLMADGANIIVRIGGRRLSRSTCEERLIKSMKDGFSSRVRLIDKHTSTIRNGQTVAFHPQPLKEAVEHDFHLRVV